MNSRLRNSCFGIAPSREGAFARPGGKVPDKRWSSTSRTRSFWRWWRSGNVPVSLFPDRSISATLSILFNSHGMPPERVCTCLLFARRLLRNCIQTDAISVAITCGLQWIYMVPRSHSHPWNTHESIVRCVERFTRTLIVALKQILTAHYSSVPCSQTKKEKASLTFENLPPRTSSPIRVENNMKQPIVVDVICTRHVLWSCCNVCILQSCTLHSANVLSV